MQVKKIILIVVALIILPFIINIPDETLNNDAQKLLDANAVPIEPQSGNGFFAVLGFEAPENKDIYEVGREAFFAYTESQQDIPPRLELSLQEFVGSSAEMPGRGQVPEYSPEKKQACLDFYTEKKDELDRLREDNGLLLARYNSLNDYNFFQNIAKPAPWAPVVRMEGPIFAGHLLTAANAAILFNQGRHTEAVRILDSNIILWRKLLAGASDLPGKTYALLALRLNYSLLEEMLDKLSTDEASVIMNRDVIAPLTPEEISTDVVWDRHFQALAWSLSNNLWPFESSQEANMSFLDRWFCKSNATLNDAYSMFHLLKKLSTVEPDKVEIVREDFSERLGGIAKLSPYKLYNPLGKNFVSSTFDYRAGVYWNRDIHSLDKLISRARVRVTN